MDSSAVAQPPIVLFLDFDGVLNGEGFLRNQRNHGSGEPRLFDPANLAALDHLCERLQVERIVVSSTWRLERSIPELRNLLAREGFAAAERVVDVTPDHGAGLRSRAGEIAAWVATHGPVRAIVLDDAPLAIAEGYFQTDAHEGLTIARVDAILEQVTQLV